MKGPKFEIKQYLKQGSKCTVCWIIYNTILHTLAINSFAAFSNKNFGRSNFFDGLGNQLSTHSVGGSGDTQITLVTFNAE